MRHLTAALLSALFSAASFADPASELAAMLEGRWDNAAQIEAGDDGDRPHLHVIHHQFENPALDGALVYAQLNVGGPDGDIYRQRVYAFQYSDGEMVMAAYEFADAAAFANAHETPDRLTGLSADMLVRFDPGCDFYWQESDEGWVGAMRDGDCIRTSRRSGRDMIIGGEFAVSGSQFTHAESGRFADTGEWVFRPTNDIPNIYDRYEADE